ncbi:hypothetical protein N7495_006881 [Penicillium taxi]|uniref:uncharacterized protein n=1 Tax=Penicillium taxi TaxID=168475 RepID=UPI002544EB4B|nr:uncharacterized protein N7495_006881 [Penicillium taxi]KAJ5895190.1 hypothetical protein N7495_006881 [Penicillium taxi]
MPTRVTKTTRESQTARRVQPKPKVLPRVERTNALNINEFVSLYISPPKTAIESTPTNLATNPAEISLQDVAAHTPLEVYSAKSIPTAALEACLDLIELTSGSAYAASGIGWSRSKKRKEMQLPDMKYLILRGVAETEEPNVNVNVNVEPDFRTVIGFLSFMVTYEDGKEVVYCYEIHLSPTVRGRGLGKLLMGRMEEIGRLVGLEKAMLTVFRSNEAAREFYKRGGYEVDEFSPQPRRLRNGTIKEWDYLILSKRL